jgi:hypothetical protein
MSTERGVPDLSGNLVKLERINVKSRHCQLMHDRVPVYQVQDTEYKDQY